MALPSSFRSQLFWFALALSTACGGDARVQTEHSAAPSATSSATQSPPSASSSASLIESIDAGLDAASDATALADADVDAGPPPECPDDMVKVGAFCVDRYEAHLIAVRDGQESPWPHFQRPESGTTYLARSASGVFPQAYISRVESAAACKNAGKRLCSLAEWSRACQGPRGSTYPYGGRSAKKGKCNSGKGHLMTQFFGADSHRWKYESFNDPKLDQEPGFLARSGEYDGCTTGEGTFDMVGNLHEWVADAVSEEFGERIANDENRKKQPWHVGNGMFLGGFFSTTSEHGAGCTFTTIAHEPTYHDYSTGFRCCKSIPKPPKPASSSSKTK
ncbi:MAG: SUMF1/EgtB/PvdO family nonheme iron enzyme [Polyangiaceae bacterium]